ncbi:MAG: hypothetical protein QNJ44_10285 [Rhodobacter sp.]|nr:hypothetical protein [Rhodobacter sp.]
MEIRANTNNAHPDRMDGLSVAAATVIALLLGAVAALSDHGSQHTTFDPGPLAHQAPSLRH